MSEYRDVGGAMIGPDLHIQYFFETCSPTMTL